jgi:hypothetical protein
MQWLKKVRKVVGMYFEKRPTGKQSKESKEKGSRQSGGAHLVEGLCVEVAGYKQYDDRICSGYQINRCLSDRPDCGGITYLYSCALQVNSQHTSRHPEESPLANQNQLPADKRKP